MPTTVTRSVRLEASPEVVWSSMADGAGLSGWLGEQVDLVVQAGASGTVVDDGTVRRIVVTEVDPGRRLGFVWWDEAAPERVSTVTIDVEATDHGEGCEVTVTERLAGAAVAFAADATLADVVGIERRWDDRLAALVREHHRLPALV